MIVHVVGMLRSSHEGEMSVQSRPIGLARRRAGLRGAAAAESYHRPPSRHQAPLPVAGALSLCVSPCSVHSCLRFIFLSPREGCICAIEVNSSFVELKFHLCALPALEQLEFMRDGLHAQSE